MDAYIKTFKNTHAHKDSQTDRQAGRRTDRETRRQTRRSLDVPGRQEESRGAVTAGGRGTEGGIARGTVDMACTDVSTGAPPVKLCALRYITVPYVTLRYFKIRGEMEEKIAEEGRNKRRDQKQERKMRREEKRRANERKLNKGKRGKR